MPFDKDFDGESSAAGKPQRAGGGVSPVQMTAMKITPEFPTEVSAASILSDADGRTGCRALCTANRHLE